MGAWRICDRDGRGIAEITFTVGCAFPCVVVYKLNLGANCKSFVISPYYFHHEPNLDKSLLEIIQIKLSPLLLVLISFLVITSYYVVTSFRVLRLLNW